MVREAESHAQEDRQRKEEIEQRNHADSVAYQAERTLKDVGDKISASLRSEVEEKIKSVREAIKANDIIRLRSLTEDLEQTLQRVGQEVYSSGQSNGATAGAGTGSSHSSQQEEGTIEGEYREV
jgi:molecular chaperone DnaK